MTEMCRKKCRSVSYGVSQMIEGAIESIGPQTCIYYSQIITIVYTGFFPIIIGSISQIMQWNLEFCLYTLLCTVFYMLLITHSLCSKTFLIAITSGMCIGLYTTLYIIIHVTHITQLFFVVCITLLYIIAGLVIPYISFQARSSPNNSTYNITTQPISLHDKEFHSVDIDTNVHSILDCF